MATVTDVAKYILSKRSPMSAMKLQKLCYYAQAWSLVWDERRLFNDRIEAWANGPVAPALYDEHRGEFEVTEAKMNGDPNSLDEPSCETVDAVLRDYGSLSAWELANMTHSEPPWLNARDGLEPGQWGDREITHGAMAEFYGSLYEQKE